MQLSINEPDTRPGGKHTNYFPVDSTYESSHALISRFEPVADVQ